MTDSGSDRWLTTMEKHTFVLSVLLSIPVVGPIVLIWVFFGFLKWLKTQPELSARIKPGAVGCLVFVIGLIALANEAEKEGVLD